MITVSIFYHDSYVDVADLSVVHLVNADGYGDRGEGGRPAVGGIVHCRQAQGVDQLPGDV